MINEPVASARRDSFLPAPSLSYSFFLSPSSSSSISSRAVALLVRQAYIILAS